MEPYLLPSHPQLTCLDPLGVVDSDNATSWQVIVAHITAFKASPKNTLCHLPALIEDLAYSLHGNGTLDSSFLRLFLATTFQPANPMETEGVLNNILESSLSLPDMFPTHSILHLSIDNPIRILSTLQVRSLVAHQLLGTLRPPRGNTWGTSLSCWYSSPQPLENAVTGYLITLFEYFKKRGEELSLVKYQLYSSFPTNADYECLQACHNHALGNLVLEPTNNDSVPFPHGTIDCMIISSNASPGFGAACTQEELVTAACPELLPLGAILIAPPIPPTSALFAQNVTPYSRWKGQGRHARLIDAQRERPSSFLLIDAAELDQASSALPDLRPPVLRRDLTKLLVGFAALRQHGISDVASPLWGAGAFGGDPVIKAIILSLAASFIGIRVHLSIDENRHYVAAETSQSPQPNISSVLRILQQLQSECQTMTVQEALTLLYMENTAQCCNGSAVADFFLARPPATSLEVEHITSSGRSV